MNLGRSQKSTALIVGIDIGSTAIRVAVGQQTVGRDVRDRQLQIIGVVETPSDGVHRGMVTSIEEVVSSITHALEQSERLIGVPIEEVWVGLTGTQMIAQPSKGVVAVAKTDGEISDEDVARAVEAARMVAAPLNYDIVHVIPRTFSVDGQMGIKDPVGMSGIRLEVDTQMIYGLSAHMKHVTKAVYRTGVDIHDLVLSIFAVGEVVTTSRQRELGVAVVNIGGSTTSLVVYEGGEAIHTVVLPIGSEHITNDLAIGLRTSIDVAERVKIVFGQCVRTGISKKDTIDLADAGSPESELVSREYVADIIAARVTEILENIDAELKKIDKSGRLPAGILFTGSGAKIRGLIELAKDVLYLPAGLGYPIDIQSSTDRAVDVSFSTAVGLVYWGAQTLPGARKQNRAVSFAAQTGKWYSNVKNLFRSLMP